MLYLNCNEEKQHGTRDFPLAFYHVDSRHPRYQMPFHWHREYEMVRVLMGSLSLTLDDTCMTLSRGTAAFIPGGAIHGGNPADCVYECLVFDPDFLFVNSDSCRQYLKKIKHRDIIIPALITAQTPSLLEILCRLFSAVSGELPGYELEVTGLLFAFFSAVFREKYYTPGASATEAPFRNSAQMKSVFEYIENHYSSPITLQQLAQLSGMSPKYFCRYFQTIAHRTPIDYVNYYRIERACFLLCTTDLPITSIAYDCGFCDSSYFIRLFRRLKHTTPKKYHMERKAYPYENEP